MMRLNPAEFNAFLTDIGQTVSWRVAIDCPCRDPHSGAADPTCPVCHGRGVTWRPGRTATLGLTQMRIAREWAGFDEWQSGDVGLTVPSDSPAYGAAENDQLVMLNSEQPWHSTYVRGAPDERWPAHLVRVLDVSVIAGGAIAERAIPVLANPEAGGTPIWPAQGAPDQGQQYSVRAVRRPVYYVFKALPQDRAHHHGAALPRRIQARAFDLFGK